MPLAEVTGFPEMLDHRVVTLHPKVHGGILADRGKESHLADMEEHGIAAFDMVVSNLYPFLESPDIETIDIGGPGDDARRGEEPRVGRDRHQPRPVRRRARGAARARCGERRHPSRARARGVRAHRGVRRRDRRVAAGRRRRCRSTCASRSSAPTSRCATARTRTSRRRATAVRARASWWDDVVQHSGLALSYLNFYDADAAWRACTTCSSPPVSGRPACAIIKHANPCGWPRSPTTSRPRTGSRWSATSGPRSAGSSRSTARSTPRPWTLMVAGPQADVVIAPGYEAGTIEALRKKRKNTRLLEAPPPTPLTRDFRQLSGGFLVQDAPPLRGRPRRVDGAHEARTDATEDWADVELAWRLVRAREVELRRAGEGRPGRRHRRRAAEPGRVG